MSELAPIAFTREHSEWDDFDRHARPRLRARFGFVASRGLDPDDVTQETLIAARSRFRPLEPFAVMYAWCRRHGLYVVMSSGARGYGRYERPCDDLATVVPITAAAPGPEAEVVDRLLVRAVLDRLDPNDREVLLLDQRDLSAEQMAAVLGTTAGAARVRLSRARSRFRAAVGDVRPVLPALANGRLARWYRGRAAHAHDLAEAVTRAAIVAPAATAAAVTFA
ncbi:MAG TPA: sigma-70 family RNA polymerase sigma factor, partial [Mycobacteriales bacterium]|nr:sigma-70 family RNA polymerase sigma factor [Mycobacteriales bacterium]